MLEICNLACYDRPAAPGPKVKIPGARFDRIPCVGEAIVVEETIYYYVYSIEWNVRELDGCWEATAELTTERR